MNDYPAMNEKQEKKSKLDGILRRGFLQESALGLGSIALACLLPSESRAAHRVCSESDRAIGKLHLPPKAKRVIFLFMAGGPSHVDLFDPKPLLNKMDGQKEAGNHRCFKGFS